MTRRLHARAGLTLVEVIAAIAILALVMVNVQMVSRSGHDAVRSGVLSAQLDNELELTLDRITLALMGTSEEEIEGAGLAPSASDHVHYSKLLGEEDGVPVMSDPESIQWSPSGQATGTVLWRQDPDTAEERQVTWSRAVPSAYTGEVVGNGEDDNGNGVLDEKGLAFTKDGDQLQIFLTVEHYDEQGKPERVDRTFKVTCRN